MWYKIDFDRLVLLLLPTFLRKPVLFGYVKALVSPIASLHYKWEQMRTANLLKLSYNGQKCYLRKALNDSFDLALRRIFISETENFDQDYIYTASENLDVFLGTLFLDDEFNYVGTTVDFLVFVPQSILDLKENEIIADVNFYKLAGKQYNIIAL
jgi:hypothetical protein